MIWLLFVKLDFVLITVRSMVKDSLMLDVIIS